jgi:hypothetical protein
MDPAAALPSVDLTTTYGCVLVGNVLAIGFWFLQIFQTYVNNILSNETLLILPSGYYYMKYVVGYSKTAQAHCHQLLR